MARQDPSPSVSGWVAVNQSTIFRSPVEVVCSHGLSRSTPESRMPIVTPRPSQVGCSFLNSTAPVSPVGRNGLSAAVSAPGGVPNGTPLWWPGNRNVSGCGSGSGIVSLRSTAATPGSLAAWRTLAVGICTVT
jgi:hypothetical protein